MKAAFDDVARCQLGLATHDELTAQGWTAREIQHAIDDHELYRMRRGVYRGAGVPITQDLVWAAAQRAAGDTHALSRLTAAAIWNLKRYPPPDSIDLLTGTASRARFEGVRATRTRWLPASDVTTRRGLRVTTAARTLADTCNDVPFAVFKSAAHDAMRRTILRPVDFIRCVEAMPRTGRHSIKPARLLIATMVPGFDPGDSEPELDVVAALKSGGYPEPDQQIWVRGPEWKYKIDVGYRCVKHGFEYQSEQEHFNRESFHDDPRRLGRLQRAGWTIWPVTSRTSRAELLLNAAAGFGHLRTA